MGINDKPKSGINADRIKMTVRVDGELYQWLHEYCVRIGAVHNNVVLIALKYFRAAKDISHSGADKSRAIK